MAVTKGNETFCENCHKIVKCKIFACEKEMTLKGITYRYTGKIAQCTECGEYMETSGTMDYNVEAFDQVYRDINGIIPLKKVIEIPQRYNIGKKPLSTLLGWGEHTFSRFYDGARPSLQYSDVLKNIADDPAFYSEILEKNKDKIGAVAYEKSRKATDALLGGTNSIISSKQSQVMRYIVGYKLLGYVSLLIILYYIQGFSYAFLGSYCFTEDCEAWPLGPVYKEAYDEYDNVLKKYKTLSGHNEDEFDLSFLLEGEAEIVRTCTEYLSTFTGAVLSKFTHMETPWIVTRGIPERKGNGQIIPKQMIGDYFCSVRKKYQMESVADIHRYFEALSADL